MSSRQVVNYYMERLIPAYCKQKYSIESDTLMINYVTLLLLRTLVSNESSVLIRKRVLITKTNYNEKKVKLGGEV